MNENLVDLVWGDKKPSRPHEKVFVLDLKFAGETVVEKFKKVSSKLNGKGDALLVTTLDDIAWFLNLRGSDIKFNPVFFAYLLFFLPTATQEPHACLFINTDKVKDEAVQFYLSENHIKVHEYDEIYDVLTKLAGNGKKFIFDENKCS